MVLTEIIEENKAICKFVPKDIFSDPLKYSVEIGKSDVVRSEEEEKKFYQEKKRMILDHLEEKIFKIKLPKKYKKSFQKVEEIEECRIYSNIPQWEKINKNQIVLDVNFSGIINVCETGGETINEETIKSDKGTKFDWTLTNMSLFYLLELNALFTYENLEDIKAVLNSFRNQFLFGCKYKPDGPEPMTKKIKARESEEGMMALQTIYGKGKILECAAVDGMGLFKFVKQI